MKAVVVTGKQKVEIRQLEQPVPQAGEILIRIHTCLLCTWEQRIFSGNGGMTLPFIPGHEASGEVAGIPEKTITSFRKGDHVVFKTLDHCGHCSFCYQGDTNLCTGKAEKRFYGGIPASGGLAEYICLHVSKVFPVSKDISFSTAAFAEPLACCIQSVGRVHIDWGDTVVIIGAGIMGLLHLKLCLLRGCRVILVEPRQERRELALKMGAHRALDPLHSDGQKEIRDLTGGEGAEHVFFTASKSSIAAEAFGYLKKKGSIVYYGSFHPNDPIQLDPNAVHYGEYVITGSFSPSTADFYRASRLLSHGLIDVSPFLSEEWKVDEAQEAMERSLSQDTFRVAVNF